MLVLERQLFERIMIGDDIVVSVERVSGGKVRLGISAPQEVPVLREELYATLPPGKPPRGRRERGKR